MTPLVLCALLYNFLYGGIVPTVDLKTFRLRSTLDFTVFAELGLGCPKPTCSLCHQVGAIRNVIGIITGNFFERGGAPASSPQNFQMLKWSQAACIIQSTLHPEG